jgi:hypothetical protein
MKNTYELVYASDFEEFFYEEDDIAVSEGAPVGIEITIQDPGSPDKKPSTEVEFQLLNGIYWNPQFEEDI